MPGPATTAVRGGVGIFTVECLVCGIVRNGFTRPLSQVHFYDSARMYCTAFICVSRCLLAPEHSNTRPSLIFLFQAPHARSVSSPSTLMMRSWCFDRRLTPDTSNPPLPNISVISAHKLTKVHTTRLTTTPNGSLNLMTQKFSGNS